MQIDMHFYGIYALARSAGINADVARKIAYSSQFVDDAIDDDAIVLSNQSAILPTMTSHKPLDYQNTLSGDQWKVWLPFHFLPGNQGSNFIEKLVCRKNSELAKLMLENALNDKHKPLWPHLIGITAHVYADTFSHFGFTGISTNQNKIVDGSLKLSDKFSQNIVGYNESKVEEFKSRLKGMFAEIVPIGHGAVATYPDRPYLEWSFKYEHGPQNPEDGIRNNFDNFVEACEALYQFFARFVDIHPDCADEDGPREWQTIEGAVKEILGKELTKYQRCQAWKAAILSDIFSKEGGGPIDYDEKLWRPRQAEYEAGNVESVTDTDACKFIRAANEHRKFVLSELLPWHRLIIT